MNLAELPDLLSRYRVRHPTVRGAEVNFLQVTVLDRVYDEWPPDGPYFSLRANLTSVGVRPDAKDVAEYLAGLPPTWAESKWHTAVGLADILADRAVPEWVFEDE